MIIGKSPNSGRYIETEGSLLTVWDYCDFCEFDLNTLSNGELSNLIEEIKRVRRERDGVINTTGTSYTVPFNDETVGKQAE